MYLFELTAFKEILSFIIKLVYELINSQKNVQ